MQPVGPDIDVVGYGPQPVPDDERVLRLVPVVWVVNCVPQGLTLQDLRARLAQMPEFRDRPDLIELGIERVKNLGSEQ